MTAAQSYQHSYGDAMDKTAAILLVFFLLCFAIGAVVGFTGGRSAGIPASQSTDPYLWDLPYYGDCETCYENHILWTDKDGNLSWQDKCDFFRSWQDFTLSHACHGRTDLPLRIDYIKNGE